MNAPDKYQSDAPQRAICPLCEKAFLKNQLHVCPGREPTTARRGIVLAIRRQFASWNIADGVCERCWESFRGVAQVIKFMKRVRIRSGTARRSEDSSSRHPNAPVGPGHLGLVLLGLVIAAGSGCEKTTSRSAQKTVVQTVRAESLETNRTGTEPAYIAIVRAENETDLSFKVGGIVEVIGPPGEGDWKEGALVKAGTVLTSLKQSDFTNALRTAEANARLTEKMRERFQKLRESDAISQQELDVTEANWLTARAQLDQARQNLHDSQLRAPTDGAVLARYVNSGVTVGAGQRLLRFADVSTMSVELGVPDRLVNYFSKDKNKEIDVEISALEGHAPFRGKVTEVGVAASQEGRLFRVVIKVPNPDGMIRSGMTATVRVGDLERFSPGSVRVPLSALVTVPAEGQNIGTETARLAVFVVRDGKAWRQPVRTGDILTSSIVVCEGLKAGDEVVTKGASLLYEGAPIEVLRTATAGE
jgi:multidrug efflux system membrane fusion protein